VVWFEHGMDWAFVGFFVSLVFFLTLLYVGDEVVV
jgi:hypothetical protein